MSGFDEKDLSRELHARSHEVGGHPIGLDAVKADARRIRRRRRAVTGAVAAAVVAITAPVALAVTGTSPTTNGPVGRPTGAATASVPPSESPTPTPSPPPSETPTPTTPSPGADKTTGVSLGVLGTGPLPKVPWLDGRTLYHDGTTTKLPGVYTDVSSYHGGWLAIGRTDQGSRVFTIDPTGKVTGDVAGGDRIAVSGDGTRIAWFADGAIHSALPSGMSDAESTQAIPNGVFADVVGWAGGRVVYSTSGGDSSSVYVTDMAGNSRVVPGLMSSRGSSDAAGLIGGMISYDNATGTSCWAVAKATGERVWHTCDWALESFSPDGSLVVGIPSDSDGLGSSRVALLDARDGTVKAVFDTAPSAFLSDFAWEDDSHVLATLYEDPNSGPAGNWGVVRLAADGSARIALQPVPSTDTEPPYHLLSHS